jgi:hypothetical protein
MFCNEVIVCKMCIMLILDAVMSCVTERLKSFK